MKGKISVTVLAVMILGLIIVPGFTAIDDNMDTGKTFGCGKSSGWDDDRDDERTATLYFTAVEGAEGKNDNAPWGEMDYTFCGEPSKFVFNGHNLKRDMGYTLIWEASIPDTMDTPMIEAYPATSNHGGNVHIKDAFPAMDLAMIEFYLVENGTKNLVLVGDEPISYSLMCEEVPVECPEGIYAADLAELDGGTAEEVAASGKALFLTGPSGEEIYYKLMADGAGSVIDAYIRIAETGSIEDQRLVQIYPSEMDLNLMGHDFMALGVINADDRFNTAVLGTADPVGGLIRAFNAGLAYVEMGGLSGEILSADCEELRDLWETHLLLWDGMCDDRDGDDREE